MSLAVSSHLTPTLAIYSWHESSPGKIYTVLRQHANQILGAEPVGIARIKEALQANDWDGGEGEEFLSESLDLGSDDEDEDGGIVPKAEVAQIEREMFGMRDAIYGQRPGQSREDDGQDEELKVEELERLMVKVQVVKGESYRQFSPDSNKTKDER